MLLHASQRTPDCRKERTRKPPSSRCPPHGGSTAGVVAAAAALPAAILPALARQDSSNTACPALALANSKPLTSQRPFTTLILIKISEELDDAGVLTPPPCENEIRRRGEKRPIPAELKDEKYFERRRRNNQAAKKSRDARRIREDQIAWRACLLEQENASLRAHIAALRQEALTLRGLLAARDDVTHAPSSTTAD
ncbi:unnamed protein product [Chilo suppressalis]|uniref:BZIP domain-containing protein n=1 Tax=Chilo suppressalis TaxID=168631 RepID=A0ABN8B7N6_CHISP|nr:unnamed protein product [Chilo suppressalis]